MKYDNFELFLYGMLLIITICCIIFYLKGIALNFWYQKRNLEKIQTMISLAQSDKKYSHCLPKLAAEYVKFFFSLNILRQNNVPALKKEKIFFLHALHAPGWQHIQPLCVEYLLEKYLANNILNKGSMYHFCEKYVREVSKKFFEKIYRQDDVILIVDLTQKYSHLPINLKVEILEFRQVNPEVRQLIQKIQTARTKNNEDILQKASSRIGMEVNKESIQKAIDELKKQFHEEKENENHLAMVELREMIKELEKYP